MKYFVGIDLGTSALKLLLVDSYGEIVKTVSRTYSVQYPKSGWSEQNPEDWWQSLLSGVKELIENTDVSKIVGMGIKKYLISLLNSLIKSRL